MILELFRRLAVLVSVFLTLLNIALLILIFFQPNLYDRFWTIWIIICFSVFVEHFCYFATRLEPMLSMWKEWSDQEILINSMFKTPEKIEPKEDMPSVSIVDLKLDHYHIRHKEGLGLAKRLITAFGSRYQGLEFYDSGNQVMNARISALIKERISGGDCHIPVVFISDVWNPDFSQLTSKNIFAFVISADEQGMKNQILDQDQVKQIDPDAKSAIALYDGKKLYNLKFL